LRCPKFLSPEQPNRPTAEGYYVIGKNWVKISVKISVKIWGVAAEIKIKICPPRG